MSEEEILDMLNGQDKELKLSVDKENIMILNARFVKDGKVMYFVVNNSEEDIEIAWEIAGKDSVEVWDPSDGSVNTVKKGEAVSMISYRGKILVFE